MTEVTQELLIDFGRAVKRARSLKGWTLGELGAKALDRDNAKSFISNIEKGKRQIGARTVGRLISALEMDESWIDRFLDVDIAPEDEETQQDRNAEHLVDVAQADPQTPPTGEALLITLAGEFAGSSPGNLETAYNDLRGALEAAASLEARAALPSNLDAQVKATLAEVARLNDEEQDFTAARTLLDTDLARLEDEITERNQARMALLDTAIDQARVMNDPAGAADYVLTRFALDTPTDPFNALRAEFGKWYETGRDKGRTFDLEVAISLAEASIADTRSADERGIALNDLATALATLGEREPSTARLEEAVTAFREALKERTRNRAPLDWAMTQMNLANALRTLGDREPGTARLEEAVTAFREALKERTRNRAPLDWAMTQMNLGNVLADLGEREPGTVRLEEAVFAYREALKEVTRDRVPLQWATTQMNLASALEILGEREPGTARLEEAVAACRQALKEVTRDWVPLQWATTQMNLANALSRLGEREPGTARLEAAVTAYREALKEYTRDNVPLDWAMTQMNLAIALAILGTREPGTARLEEAITAYHKSLRERTRDRVPLDWAITQVNLANTELALHRKSPDPARLAKARARVVEARAIFTEGAPLYLEKADELLAAIDAAARPT